jgi:hypothetical protein
MTLEDGHVVDNDDGMPTFWNDAGRPFRTRLVRTGDRYGLNDCLVHDKPGPMVEFYDASQDPEKFGPRGQFVTRYYASTLTRRERSAGLDLDCGIPGWKVDGCVMEQVTRWMESQGAS